MKFTKVFLLLGVMSLAFSSLAANCPQACDKFVSCTEEINKTKANAQQKTLLTKSCSESCKKHEAKILECYGASQLDNGSCNVYSACIMRYAQMMKKTGK